MLLAGIAAILLLPVALIVGCAVRWQMGSPVLFAQERPGLRGRPFRMFKFRTMRHAAGEHGELLPDDARLTRLGKALRASSLDELPEIWNVLRGEMSIVGPRPLLMEYLPLYSIEQARRHEVRPGITGWAQVNGRNAISWREKFSYDVWYVDNVSLALDLRIIFLTVLRVFSAHGINQPGSATMEKFKGEI